MSKLITTLGPKSADELGMILPHEHVFVDLRTWDQPGYAQADPAGRIYELGEEQTSEVYTVSCSNRYVGLEQFWA